MQATALLAALAAAQVAALPDIIRVGGIFVPEDTRLELAFRTAIEWVNKDKSLLTRSTLYPMIEKLRADDSYQASKRVCGLLRHGVAGVFGPQATNTADHVQAICDAMEVPHIETRWADALRREPYSLNLYPHPESLSRAYYDIVKRLGWKAFVILYDSADGLVRMQTLLKANEFRITVRELPPGDDWRPLLKQIRKSQMTKLVLDVQQDRIYEVLRQASQIGLMREYHSYFITSLDLHLVPLEDFQYGGTNITALRLIDPSNEETRRFVEDWRYEQLRFSGHSLPDHLARITTEAALMMDAVHLFARSLSDLDAGNTVQVQQLYCEGDSSWTHGAELINYMKWYSSIQPESLRPGGAPSRSGPPLVPTVNGMPLVPIPGGPMSAGGPGGMPFVNRSHTPYSHVHVYGLSGLIKFDRHGFRKDFDLDIVELDSQHGLTKVGHWSLVGGANYTRSYIRTEDGMAVSLQNRTLVVTTAITPPYTMLVDSHEKLYGNDRFEGFCIDLIHNISEVLGFNYTIQLVKDGAYGSKDKETGEWNGMIKELLDHKADLGIVDFTITYEREEAVDFSMPFMNLGISIIFKKPSKKDPSLFSFLLPFSLDVWIYMATAYLGVSVVLFVLARMVPQEWEPSDIREGELETQFTLNNSLWFNIATFLCQGADIAPKACSTRIVAGIWWFFTLIMISSYTANLAAFLTVERMDSPITGAADLAKQTKIKYGCKFDGATYGFFSESNIPTYKHMWTNMNNARPTVFTPSNAEGVERVSKSDGMYAFMMESSSIDYETERRCDLMQVGGLLDSKSYGIALPPGSPYTNAISSAILKLKERGVLSELKNEWWTRRNKVTNCTKDEEEKDDASSAELDLDNVGGVFVVMVGGFMIAAFIAMCEFTWKARKLATELEDSFFEELKKELRFILKFSETTKPVRKKTKPGDLGSFIDFGTLSDDKSSQM